MNKKEYLKKILLGLMALIVYFAINNYAALPFTLLGIDVSNLPSAFKYFYTLLIDCIIAALLIIIFRKTLISNFKDLKKNHRQYFSTYIKYWFIALGIMMLSNLIIMLFTNTELSNNEQLVRQQFEQNPIYMFITAVIFAPAIEELVFRQAIRNIITNNWVFIIISGLVFGSLHVITSYQTPTDLLYLIPYSAPGIIFAYTLVKSKNIFVPMGLHFIHNGLLLSLQFVVLIFG